MAENTNSILEWLNENKEWVFSGIGISIICGVWWLIKMIFIKDVKQQISKDNATDRLPQQPQSQTQSQSQTVTVNVNTSSPTANGNVAESAKIAAAMVSIEWQKTQTNILFIDDDKEFKIVNILKKAGWKKVSLYPNSDVTDLDNKKIQDAHIIFVDIKGVAKTLFDDEGLGLAVALKKKYQDKKLVLYSAVPEHKTFHEAWSVIDDKIEKNAQPAEFISCIETLAEKIWKS